MGFWDTAGKLAKGAANALEEKSNELHAIKMRLESKRSEELKRLIKGSSRLSGEGRLDFQKKVF